MILGSWKTFCEKKNKWSIFCYLFKNDSKLLDVHVWHVFESYFQRYSLTGNVATNRNESWHWERFGLSHKSLGQGFAHRQLDKRKKCHYEWMEFLTEIMKIFWGLKHYRSQLIFVEIENRSHGKWQKISWCVPVVCNVQENLDRISNSTVSTLETARCVLRQFYAERINTALDSRFCFPVCIQKIHILNHLNHNQITMKLGSKKSYNDQKIRSTRIEKLFSMKVHRVNRIIIIIRFTNHREDKFLRADKFPRRGMFVENQWTDWWSILELRPCTWVVSLVVVVSSSPRSKIVFIS